MGEMPSVSFSRPLWIEIEKKMNKWAKLVLCHFGIFLQQFDELPFMIHVFVVWGHKIGHIGHTPNQ